MFYAAFSRLCAHEGAGNPGYAEDGEPWAERSNAFGVQGESRQDARRIAGLKDELPWAFKVKKEPLAHGNVVFPSKQRNGFTRPTGAW
jgi:hypothetical protein